MIAVKATREGLIGSKTASGYVIDTVVPYVALPARTALHAFIRIAANGRARLAIVLDIDERPGDELRMAFLCRICWHGPKTV